MKPGDRIRYAHRRDKGEQPIITTLRLHGWLVVSLSGTPGLPDLLVLKPGALHFLEVKGKGGGMEAAQVELHREFARVGLVVPIVTTPAQALEAVSGGPVRTYRDVRHKAPKGQRKARAALLARLRSTSLLGDARAPAPLPSGVEAGARPPSEAHDARAPLTPSPGGRPPRKRASEAAKGLAGLATPAVVRHRGEGGGG